MVLYQTEAMHDALRKAIAEHECRLAKSRRQSKQADALVCQTQALLELTLDSLKHTLQQIETAQEVVATSQALLKWSAGKGVELSSRLGMPRRRTTDRSAVRFKLHDH